MESEHKLKHLEFIQSIISRLNNNSFQVKAVAVTIITGLLAFHSTNPISNIYLLIIVPTLIFWFLDAMYLSKETKFRKLYSDAAGLTSIQEVKLFSMDNSKYDGELLGCFFSWSIWPLYLPVVLISAFKLLPL